MNKKDFRKFLRECIEEVLTENLSENEFDGINTKIQIAKEPTKDEMDMAKKVANIAYGNVYLVRFHSSSKKNDTNYYEVFLHSSTGPKKWIYKNKNGQWFSSVGEGATSTFKQIDVPVNDPTPKVTGNGVNEMTSTGAAQGFMGKNWVDPDPDRKRMKSIASKSVGGKVT